MEEKIMNFDDLKKGAEDALKKTVEGAKDLADKAADKTKEIAGSEVAQNIKKGTEEVFEKTVEGAKDLANKAANNKIVKDVEKGAEKAVDKIHLYSYQAEKHLETFSLREQQWDINTLPSTEVIKARRKQFQDKTLRLQLIARAYSVIPRMSPPIKAIVEALIEQLKD